MKVSHDSETPAHGQQVITACAFIHHDFEGIEKVFLAKRADTKKFLPGLYELPGGHIDYEEGIIDGLKREVKEEFGMSIEVGDPFAVFTYNNQIKGSHSVEAVYFAKFIEPLVQITFVPEDHSGITWRTEEEVVDNRLDMIPTQHVEHKLADDPEYQAVLKGFALLRGEKLRT